MKRLAGVVCSICLFGAADLRADAPTYNKDIAPILWKNCAGCHRAGEIGPFSLLDLQRRRQAGELFRGDHREPADASLEARAWLWLISR